MPADLELVRAFEAELDAALAAATVAGSDANANLGLAANIYESAFSRSEWIPIAELFGRGMTILARSLVSGSQGPEPDVATLVADMQFASHYFMVREYLYYTYNAQTRWRGCFRTIEWRFGLRTGRFRGNSLCSARTACPRPSNKSRRSARFCKPMRGCDSFAHYFLLRGIPHFDGFVTAIQQLVITSNNSGMFFGAEATRVINFRTLTRLLRRSDGDIAFIQHVLATYDTHADQATNCAMAEFQMGRRAIAYEGVSNSPVLDFPAVEWRSSPERQRLIDEFIASGAHPFDVLGGEGESTARDHDGKT